MSIPNFLDFMKERDQLDEAFNSAPYELTMGKKNAGDVFFTFIDEDDKEYRIQFYTPQGLGKNVRQVFIGQKRGSVYPDAIARFKNPMRVIASMIEATKQFMATPLGKTIDGYAVNFSKKALDRGMTLIPKIIRQSGLKQKLNVMDLTYAPVPDRGYVWLVKKGKDPAQVFDGPKMQGITWDDPDKVGDVPDQAKADAALQGNIDMIPTTDMGQEGLRDGGYIARLLGIIDTYAPQMVGMYSGEKLTRVGAGRYKTSGGLVIEVHFWGVDKGNLAVEVSSELSGTEMLSLSGKTKDAGMKIVEAISRAAGSQFNGEVEVRAVPINGAPYPILKVSRSQGYSYVDCGSFVLKVSDALLERFTVGKAVELDLMREFPRTTFPVRYDWYGKTELVVKASDGKTIFGSINTNASDKDAVITANLKAPSNGTFFGETVHGFSVAWDFKFPRGGNLQDAKIVTNVTYNFDKKKANITTMIVEGHHQHSNSSYDVNLDVKTVQSVLNEYSDRLKIINQQLRNLDSSSYNPNKRFLNDVTISKSGEILFQGQSLTQSQNRQAVINALAKAQSNAEKTKGDLANYAASIEASAPQGRDLDWRVYLTNNGNSLQVDWEITFRRNTHVGAMKEFSAQVYRGNRYLEDVYADAKSRGYAPEQPNLMAMSDAQRSDDMAMMNGEDAYSEYEQSIGGSLKINLK
ncbi:hypothetical protein PLAPEKGO_00057 [Klebsiella phage KP6]